MLHYPKYTIGLLVGPSKEKFTAGAWEWAQQSPYDIILTDKRDVCIDILESINNKLYIINLMYKYIIISYIIIIILYILIIKILIW